MDCVILTFPEFSPYLSVAFPDGSTPLDYVVSRVGELARDRSGGLSVKILHPGVIPEDINRALPNEWPRIAVPGVDRPSGQDALESLYNTVTDEVEHLLWIDGLAPLWSVSLARHLLNLHRKSWCDYTFADGYPEGYAAEVLRRDILPTLAALAESKGILWTRKLLFDTLMVDINAFDIETEAAREDYSLLRASLTVNHRGDYLLCRQLAAEAAQAGQPPVQAAFLEEEDQILRALLHQGQTLRTVPRYLQVQVTRSMTSVASFSPWKGDVSALSDPSASLYPTAAGEMSPELFGTLLDQLHELSPEATVSLGYRGEVALHTRLPELLSHLDRLPRGTFFLETSGVGWGGANRHALLETSRLSAIIVEVDAARKETYETLRGPWWEEVQQFIADVVQAHPGKVFVQATRIGDNEWELQEFFRHWNDTAGATPIIQKYNDFAGQLPDLKVADLSPLSRCPCFHLQRDLVVLHDGTVPRCFQDLSGEVTHGRVGDNPLLELWQRGAGEYQRHLEQDYPELCRRCDEYYTFNA